MKHWTVLEVVTAMLIILGSMAYFAGKSQQTAMISGTLTDYNNLSPLISPDASFLTLVVAGFSSLYTFRVTGAEIFSLFTWIITVVGLLVIYILIRSGNN